MSLKDFISDVNNNINVCKTSIENADKFNDKFEKFKLEYEKYNKSLKGENLKSDFIFGKPYKI